MRIWNFISYLIGIRASLITRHQSTGDCDYAKDLEMNKVCSAKVTKEMVLRWRDRFTTVNTDYEIWTSSKDAGVVLVTFYKSPLSKKDKFDMGCVWPKKGKCDDFPTKKGWSLHCFKHAMGYVEHLRTHCLQVEYDQSKTVAKPVLLYTRPRRFTKSAHSFFGIDNENI